MFCFVEDLLIIEQSVILQFMQKRGIVMPQNQNISNYSIASVLESAPWLPLEEHLNELRERVDSSIKKTHELREQYRQELLTNNPELVSRIQRVSQQKMDQAIKVFKNGTIAASDGTVAPVPLLAGSKIQVGVVVVSNRGDVVDLVTRVFEAELNNNASDACQFFLNLRNTRSISNLLSRAIMLFGERRMLIEHEADWRLLHGELVPHELRTGAGNPSQNLQPTFDLINSYIRTKQFIAVSEASDDIDILNAAILLQPGEFIVIRTMEDTLNIFLEGDQDTGQAAANFNLTHRQMFRSFINSVGPEVAVVLVKAGPKPFLLECHQDYVEDSVAIFLADSLWARGLSTDGSAFTVRGFPFHIDLADQVAGTLFKSSDFRHFIEARLFELGLEAGLFDIDARRTRA